MAFQIEKDLPKNVKINPSHSVIPDKPIVLSSSFSQSGQTSTIGVAEDTDSQPTASAVESIMPPKQESSSSSKVTFRVDTSANDDTSSTESDSTSKGTSGRASVNGAEGGSKRRVQSGGASVVREIVSSSDSRESSVSPAIGDESSFEEVENGVTKTTSGGTEGIDDDRLRRLAELADPESEETSGHLYPSPSLSLPRRNSPRGGRSTPQAQVRPPTQHPPPSSASGADSLEGRTSIPAPGSFAPSKPTSSSAITFVFNRSQRELSRLLVEKIPLEILKRMVIRWPVGEEQFQDRSALNARRLMINVWDASGDPLQQSFIPFFYSDRCIFVTTYDLTKGLDCPCESYQRKHLTNVNGSIPTNAEVLEGWIGCATAHSKHTPSIPFKCTKRTPILPPIIITCTNSDNSHAQPSSVEFLKFYSRKSFDTYKKHLVESASPSALRISNRYETHNNRCDKDVESHYSGHHLLRREIDYLARQMPYIHDDVPIQWVKFEQLICGLQQQKKVVLLFDDLSKYVLRALSDVRTSPDSPCGLSLSRPWSCSPFLSSPRAE